MSSHFYISIIITFFLIFQSTLSAQRLSEPLKEGQFEAGYSHYWHRGDFYWDFSHQIRNDWWNNGTLYLRAGLFDIISISLEGMLFSVASSGGRAPGPFWNLILGFGASSRSFTVAHVNVSFTIHYLDNLYIDTSEKKSDKKFRHIVIGIPVRYRITEQWHKWTLLIAPVYIWEISDYFEDQKYTGSRNDPGISIGLEALVSEHFYLKVNTIYSDFFQPQITVGYRFE
jgi:hypothetical protein